VGWLFIGRKKGQKQEECHEKKINSTGVGFHRYHAGCAARAGCERDVDEPCWMLVIMKRKNSMRNSQKSKQYKLFMCIGALGLAMTSTTFAAIAPYTVDTDTLHLWHFDEAASASTAQDSVVIGGYALTNMNRATLGNAGLPAFGNAGDTSAASNSILRSSSSTTAPVGTGGAFTYEAMINISTTAGTQQIFAMENNNASASLRPFWFRINEGVLGFTNLAGGGTGSSNIPTTGDDAFVANEWFHVAVTYDGNQGTAGNLKLYWTRVDASRTKANLIGSASINDLSTTATAMYGIGNDNRTTGTGNRSNLKGRIDEVRLSGIARDAKDMLFFTPRGTRISFF